MMCELELWLKALIVAVANLIGVYVVKFLEEKARKDKLWRVESTVEKCYRDELHETLLQIDISHNYIDNVGRYAVFNIYCPTQKESAIVKEILSKYNAKYFVTETKNL